MVQRWFNVLWQCLLFLVLFVLPSVLPLSTSPAKSSAKRSRLNLENLGSKFVGFPSSIAQRMNAIQQQLESTETDEYSAQRNYIFEFSAKWYPDNEKKPLLSSHLLIPCFEDAGNAILCIYDRIKFHEIPLRYLSEIKEFTCSHVHDPMRGFDSRIASKVHKYKGVLNGLHVIFGGDVLAMVSNPDYHSLLETGESRIEELFGIVVRDCESLLLKQKEVLRSCLKGSVDFSSAINSNMLSYITNFAKKEYVSDPEQILLHARHCFVPFNTGIECVYHWAQDYELGGYSLGSSPKVKNVAQKKPEITIAWI